MNKIRYIDRDAFPKKNGKIDWKKSVGVDVRFQHDDVIGSIRIEKILPNKWLIVKYNNCEYKISQDSLLKCTLSRMLKKRSYDWKYDIGHQVVFNNVVCGVVIDRFLLIDNSQKQPHRYYLIECNKCHTNHKLREDKIDKKWQCPVCSNRKIIKGINDLWTLYPEIASQLLNPNDGYKISLSSTERLDWKCQICGNIVHNLTPYLVNHAVNHLVPCPSCADGFSYPNKFMYNILNSSNYEFEREKGFDWPELGNRKYDFYIIDTNTIIEMQGIQHYTNDNVIRNDIEKKEIAKKNGINNYIVIDSRYTDADYIWNNICSSDLSKMINLNNIDINKIDFMSRKSIFGEVFKSCVDNDFDAKIVSSLFNIHTGTVYSYIRRYIQLGMVSQEEVDSYRLERRKNKKTKVA